MNAREIIQKELEIISPLLALVNKTNVFTVPQGYFNSIVDTVLIGINENIDNEDAFKLSKNLPADYFENLASDILNKIKNIETSVLSPTLFQVQPKNIFTIPNNYFEKLPQQIIAKTKPTGKVFLFNNNRFEKYAIAAMLTGAIALGVYTFVNKTETNAAIPSQSLATIDPIIEKGKDMNTVQFNEALNNLSDDAIATYLEKNGSELDIASLSSSIDDDKLPSKNDYLLNKNLLDIYLPNSNN